MDGKCGGKALGGVRFLGIHQRGEADVRLCVVVNSLLPIDRGKGAREVVEENLRINGPRKKPDMSWKCTGPSSITGGIVPGG